ncbi:methyltransferase [Myroides sp. DF42-4-2]|uniref:methyltransferase n=1 Tax=unclassified Myroides TaxID=2642485 RepID=UPI002578CEE3|nr:methyltransferase [Myroides sp. DF42-4-2]
MKMTKELNKAYWEDRYRNQEAKWNAKSITTPLQAYIDQLTQTERSILVPGVGHGHELLYLHRKGFTSSVGIDLTAIAMEETAKEHADFPVDHVIIGDFFAHEGQYDLILEQTFFCSLPMEKREDYVKKMYELLRPNGKLVGVLFDAFFEQLGPPFGGDRETYKALFEPYFTLEVMEPAFNSIKPRQDRELFIILKKKI